MDSKLSGVLDMLEEAAIQLSEASDELRHYCDRLDLDPNRLFELEQRISRQISLARKHHVRRKSCQPLSVLLEEQQQLDDRPTRWKPSAGGESASSAGAGDSKTAA
jgi:DNA repair protein RecN (Recombination protein N)